MFKKTIPILHFNSLFVRIYCFYIYFPILIIKILLMMKRNHTLSYFLHYTLALFLDEKIGTSVYILIKFHTKMHLFITFNILDVPIIPYH